MITTYLDQQLITDGIFRGVKTGNDGEHAAAAAIVPELESELVHFKHQRPLFTPTRQSSLNSQFQHHTNRIAHQSHSTFLNKHSSSTPSANDTRLTFRHQPPQS